MVCIERDAVDLVFDVRAVDDLPAANCADNSGRAIRARRILGLEATRRFGLARICVSDRGATKPAVVLDEIDDTPVCEVWNRELGDLRNHLVVVERRREGGADLAHQPGLRDVGATTEPARDLACLVADGHRARQEPVVMAVLPAQRIGILPWLTGHDGVPVLRGHVLDVGGMMKLLPSPASQRFEGSAGILVPAAVVPEPRTRRVGHPCQLRDVVGERLQLLLSLLRLLRGLDRRFVEHVLPDRGRRACDHRREQPLVLRRELVRGPRAHVRDADHLSILDQRDAVQGVKSRTAQDRADDLRLRHLAERHLMRRRSDGSGKALPHLHDQVALDLAPEPHRGAHAKQIPFAKQDRRRVHRGRRLLHHVQQALQQLVEIAAAERLGRDPIERAQRPVSRLRVAIDRGTDRDVDRFVECPQIRELRRIHDLASPHLQDAGAKHPVLGHDLREIEAFLEPLARVQLGDVDRQARLAPGPDTMWSTSTGRARSRATGSERTVTSQAATISFRFALMKAVSLVGWLVPLDSSGDMQVASSGIQVLAYSSRRL